jgi:outer membrane lipoprotein-sorting protein
MKLHMIGACFLAALLPMVCAVGAALPAAAAEMPAVLINAGLATEKAGSYHIEMTTSFGGKPMTSTGDMQSYTPMKMRMTSTTPEGPMQMIILAPDSYMKMGSAPWKKFPGNPADFTQMDFHGLIAKNKDNFVVTDLGMETRDGQSLHAYKIVNQTKNSTQTVFLDSAGRFARLEMPNMVMKFSNFGEPVNIAAPM